MVLKAYTYIHVYYKLSTRKITQMYKMRSECKILYNFTALYEVDPRIEDKNALIRDIETRKQINLCLCILKI